MYCPIALLAWSRVANAVRQMSSVLIVLNTVSTIALSKQFPLPLIEAMKP
jgi:hypothetical protein